MRVEAVVLRVLGWAAWLGSLARKQENDGRA